MLTLTTPPAVEPVDLAGAKLALKVDSTDDDARISSILKGARRKCESYLNRSFVTTGWRQTLDGFPGQFSRFSPALGTFAQGSYGYGMGALYGYIPERLLTGTAEPVVVAKAPLLAVSAVTYQHPTTLERLTLDPSLYSVEPGDGGRVSPAVNHVWPTALVYPGSVQIDLTVGYGPDASDVPETVTEAILQLTSYIYYNRGDVSAELPPFIRWMLSSEDWGCRT